MDIKEKDQLRVAPLMNGKALPQHDEAPHPAPKEQQENKTIETHTNYLTVGDFLNEPQSCSSSRRSSLVRWKTATDVIIATNILLKHDADKQVAMINRKMEGTNAYIPVLPLWLSIVLLIFNCVVPGSGTMLSGFAFCCVGTTYKESDRKQLKDKIIGTAMINVFTGVAQLFTIAFIFVGWFWSVSRGITMVYLAMDAKDSRKFKTPVIKNC